VSAQKTVTSLPIDSALPGILTDFRAGHSLLITAEPGSGKTTRIPPALMKALEEETKREVWVLEPRRLAAALSARRVAEELGQSLPGQVGYHFRNEQKFSSDTRLLFLTEGMMLRRMLSDPLLKRVGAIVLDEFHERHADTDLALACIQALRKGPRPDLRLVILSATLDVAALQKYLGPDCRVHHAPGKVFPLNIHHLDSPLEDGPSPSFNAFSGAGERAFLRTLQTAVELPLGVHEGAKQGRDVLVFLPGFREIQSHRSLLQSAIAENRLPPFRVEVLYGDASDEEQERALTPSREGEPRRLILATNLAESSVTLTGVGTVIDSGLARVVSESDWSGISALRTRPISRASLTQRAGRAARQGPGRVFRLLTKPEEASRLPFDLPELLRTDLSAVLLQVDTWRSRLAEVLNCSLDQTPVLDFLDSPSVSLLRQAQENLESLGALSPADRALTPIGKRMGEIPLSPRLTRVLLEAERLDVLPLAIRAVAAISEGALQRQAGQHEPDLWELLSKRARLGSGNLGFHEKKLISQLGGAFGLPRVEQIPVFFSDSQKELLTRAFFSGFSDRVAQVKGRGPEATLSQGGVVSVLDEVWMAAHRYFLVIEASQSARLGERLRYPRVELALPLSPDELMDWGLERVRDATEWSFDPVRARIDAFDRLYFGILQLEERRISPDSLRSTSKREASIDLATRAMEKAISRESDLRETLRLRSFYQRWEFFRTKTLPSDRQNEGHAAARQALISVCADFIESLSLWTVNELLREENIEALMSLMGSEIPEFDQIEREVPERLDLPGRKRVLLHYPDGGGSPWVESRLQDFFGMKNTPTILRGQVAVTCHLLAPSQRPVQVTQDLQSFWKTTYPQLRGELSRRYPRHAWPENP
jgi:ATP-dependent helicase HrpB